MSIDQKASIRSILEVLTQEGVKTGDVAKQIPGISEKPFRNALKEAGYEFRNSGQKDWVSKRYPILFLPIIRFI